jgi:hypothetical protein
MKKIILTSVLVLTFFNAHPQEALSKASKQICECATEKIQYIDDVQNEQKDAFLYICTTDIFNSNLKEILKDYGITINIDGTFERFTQDVNKDLSNNCPKVLPSKNETTIDSNISTTNLDAPKKEEIIDCTVLNITNYQYPTIEAKDKNGILQSFIIFRPFSTDILFTAGGIKVGNYIKISFQTEEIYDSNTKAFKTYKVITQLEKLK